MIVAKGTSMIISTDFAPTPVSTSAAPTAIEVSKFPKLVQASQRMILEDFEASKGPHTMYM